MKRNNKKGFTIVELVVVIAVIAILSAVLIPTFSGVTKDAKEKAALADARAIASQYMVDHPDFEEASIIVKLSDGVFYEVTNGVAAAATCPEGKIAQPIDCSADPDHANCAKIVTFADAPNTGD